METYTVADLLLDSVSGEDGVKQRTVRILVFSDS